MLLNCRRKCCGQIERWAAEMDRFVRGDGWFVTQLVHFWEPLALCSRVSSRRAFPVAPGRREGVGGWLHLRPVSASGQIHTMGNVFAFPHEYVVWVLKDPDFRGNLTVFAPERAARNLSEALVLGAAGKDILGGGCWEDAHSPISFRASGPPAWAWGLQHFQHRCRAWRSPPGSGHGWGFQAAGGRQEALLGSEQGLKSFPCLSSSSHSTPTHVSPAQPGVLGKPVRCARAATSRSARARDSSSRRVLAVPPGSGSCPTRPHPYPSGCARNPSPGQCASSPAPRLRPGQLLSAKQAEVGRSGRPARGARTLAGRTPLLSRVAPRGGYWGVRKDGTGPGRAAARTRRGRSAEQREGAVFLAKDSDRQEPKQNKKKGRKKSARLSRGGKGSAAGRGKGGWTDSQLTAGEPFGPPRPCSAT